MFAKKMASLGLVAALVALASGPVSAFTASNLLRVNPVSEGTFEVIGRGGIQTGDYWCAAAEYLLYNGMNNATRRIYVVRELGYAETENRRSAVQFSLTAPEGVDTRPGFTLSVKRVGENLSSGSARNYCYDLKLREVF